MNDYTDSVFPWMEEKRRDNKKQMQKMIDEESGKRYVISHNK